MKRLFIILLLVGLLMSGCGTPPSNPTTEPTLEPTISTEAPTDTATEPTEPETTTPTEPELVTPQFNFSMQKFTYTKFDNIEDLLEERIRLEKYAIEFMIACGTYANQLELNGDAEGWEFLETVLKPEQEYLLELQKQYMWDYKAFEYPVATYVWLYMKNEFGWSDIVCAGVMGNLMAECGGCWTQDLDWTLKGSSGLGMVQWLGSRREEITAKYGPSPSVDQQLQFMYDELYGLNGVTKQVKNSEFTEIMEAITPEDCAFAFASYYERCSNQYRSPRKRYARIAYEYFVEEVEAVQRIFLHSFL